MKCDDSIPSCGLINPDPSGADLEVPGAEVGIENLGNEKSKGR